MKTEATACPMAFGLATAGAAGERRELMREMERRVKERTEEMSGFSEIEST